MGKQYSLSRRAFVSIIGVTAALTAIAWLSLGAATIDGRPPYRAIPYEPGGLRPVATEAPVPDGPRATEPAKVASASTATPPPPPAASAPPLGKRAQATRTADLNPKPKRKPTAQPTSEPTSSVPKQLPKPKPVVRRPSVTVPTSATVAAARAYALDRVGAVQFACLDQIFIHESHWNPYDLNPSSGAYGIPQSVPGSKMASAGADWRTNPVTQVRWALGYIGARYGTPCGAWSFWQRAKWY